MSYAFLLIFNDSVQIDVLNASENIGFNKGVDLLELSDELLGLKALGGSGSVLMTS